MRKGWLVAELVEGLQSRDLARESDGGQGRGAVEEI